jgi:NIPSNAP
MRKLMLWAVVGLTITFMSNATSMYAQSGRVYELRTYTCPEGKLTDLLKRFREHTMEIFERHHMHNVGYWIPEDEPRHSNTLIYIIRHDSRVAAEANWKAFRDDPEWQKVSKASEEHGKIVSHVESVFMAPTDFSQLK